MYKVYVSGWEDYEGGSWYRDLFFTTESSSDQYALSNAKVELEQGKTGSFSFSVPLTNWIPQFESENPNWTYFRRMTSYVDVFRDDDIDPFFTGRVFEVSKDFDDTYNIDCEGMLAVLNDVILPPAIYKDTLGNVLASIFEFYNNALGDNLANAIKFNNIPMYINVDTTQKVSKTYDDYQTVLERLLDLVEMYGGYLEVKRHCPQDYGDPFERSYFRFYWKTDDASWDAEQRIEFGDNLIDLVQSENNTDEIFTRLYPFGASLVTGEFGVTLTSDSSEIADGRTLELRVAEDSYSVANNTSTLKWTLSISGGNDIGNYNTYAKITIDQKKQKEWDVTYDDWEFPGWDGSGTEDPVTSYSDTLTVKHDADGRRDVPIVFEYKIFGQPEVKTVNGLLRCSDLNHMVQNNSVTVNSHYRNSDSSDRRISLTVSEESINVANNTSNLKWVLKLDNLPDADQSVATSVVAQINGETVYSESAGVEDYKFPAYAPDSDKRSKSGYIVVPHDDDGSKTLSNSIFLKTSFDNGAASIKNTSMTLKNLSGMTAIEDKMDEYLTIATSSKSGGKKHIDNDAGISEFGIIAGQYTWDDITDPDELYDEAEAYLESISKALVEIEVTAVDLSLVDSDIESFHIGARVTINSDVHGIVNELYYVKKMSIDLLNPENDTLTFGDIFEGYIRKNHEQTDYYQELSLNEEAIKNLMDEIKTINQNITNNLTYITNLEANTRYIGVGVRNYIYQSMGLKKHTKSSDSMNAETIMSADNPTPAVGELEVMRIQDRQGSYIWVPTTVNFLTYESIQKDGIFSFYAKADTECTLKCVVLGIEYEFHITRFWERYWTPVDFTKITEGERVYFYPCGPYTYLIHKAMLHFGQNPVDWVAAPEDGVYSVETHKYHTVTESIDEYSRAIGIEQRTTQGGETEYYITSNSIIRQTAEEIMSAISLEDYYTKSEVDGEIAEVLNTARSEITQSANSITSTVANTYQTKSDMSNYYTKTETSSQITQTASSITTTVSQTYQTKSGMSDYYTKTGTETQITQTVNSIMASYVKDNEVIAAINLDDSGVGITGDHINMYGEGLSYTDSDTKTKVLEMKAGDDMGVAYGILGLGSEGVTNAIELDGRTGEIIATGIQLRSRVSFGTSSYLGRIVSGNMYNTTDISASTVAVKYGHILLSSGTYIIRAHAAFSSAGDNTYRRVAIWTNTEITSAGSTSTEASALGIGMMQIPAINGRQTHITVTRIVKVESSTYYYLVLGSEAKCNILYKSMDAVQLSGN